MSYFNTKFSLFLIIFTMIVLSSSVNAETEHEPVIAVLPFINYSNNSSAVTTIMDVLYAQMDTQNVEYFSHTDIRPILRKNRIRAIGLINQEDALYIKNSADVDRIILGAINNYVEGQNPELSLSVRIIDVNSMTIIAAVSQSALGKDYEKLFGLGTIESIEILAQKVVEDLVTKLVHEIDSYDNSSNGDSFQNTIALIPFDNISQEKHAGSIVADILLTELVQHRFKVIEPGIINSMMLKNKQILRGEVDFKTLNQIKTELDIQMLVTGSVEVFQPSRGSQQSEMEFGIRTLDASNGKIINMFNDIKKGNDSESIFGLGKINAIGNLITKSVNEYISILEKKSEKYFAKQN